MRMLIRLCRSGAATLALLGSAPALAGPLPPGDGPPPCNSICRDWLRTPLFLFDDADAEHAHDAMRLPSRTDVAVRPSPGRSAAGRLGSDTIGPRPVFSARRGPVSRSLGGRTAMAERGSVEGKVARKTNRWRGGPAVGNTQVPLPPLIERHAPSLAIEAKDHPSPPLEKPPQAASDETFLASVIPVALAEQPTMSSRPEMAIRLAPPPRRFVEQPVGEPREDRSLFNAVLAPGPDDIGETGSGERTPPPVSIERGMARRASLAAVRPELGQESVSRGAAGAASPKVSPAVMVLMLSLAILLGSLVNAPFATRHDEA